MKYIKSQKQINEELFGLTSPSIQWIHNENDRSITIKFGDTKWKLIDNIFKDIRDASSIFHKVSTALKFNKVADDEIDKIKNILKEFIRFGTVEQL